MRDTSHELMVGPWPRLENLAGKFPGIHKLLLTRKEAAFVLSVEPRTISRAWESGDLRRVQAPGTIGRKGVRVDLLDLVAYIEGQGQVNQGELR